MKKNVFIFLFLNIIVWDSCCKPGIGGDATIIVTLQHHGSTIPNHIHYADTVYLKFNSTDLSNTEPSGFDKYFTGKYTDNTITCDGLKCGKYMFYCAGWDSVGGYPRVTGGLPVTIKHKDRKENINLIVPVSE